MPLPLPNADQLEFDIEKYVRNSKKVDIGDIDLSQAAKYPLSEGEIRALAYMTDIESHTIVYLRAILNTCATEDPRRAHPGMRSKTPPGILPLPPALCEKCCKARRRPDGCRGQERSALENSGSE